MCIGPQSVCPVIVPSVTTIPNINIRSGYGTGYLTLAYNPNTEIGVLHFRIEYHKLYSQGNLVPARVLSVEIRGPFQRCGEIANIVVDASGIYQRDTGGESMDSYVLGAAILNKDKAQQLLKERWLIVVRTLAFQIYPFGEISGRIAYERKSKNKAWT